MSFAPKGSPLGSISHHADTWRGVRRWDSLTFHCTEHRKEAARWARRTLPRGELRLRFADWVQPRVADREERVALHVRPHDDILFALDQLHIRALVDQSLQHLLVQLAAFLWLHVRL